MNFLNLSLEELKVELDTVRSVNKETLDDMASLFEVLVEMVRKSKAESLLKELDRHRRFFRHVENYFEEIAEDIEYRNLSLELINRMGRFGDEAFDTRLALGERIDKERFYVVDGASPHFNKLYGDLGDNLHSLTFLSSIASALDINFRHVTPLVNVPRGSIRNQDDRGFTITSNDEIYFGETPIRVTGQRRELLIALIMAPTGHPTTWETLSDLIVRGGHAMDQKTLVKRISALRTRLKDYGIEIQQLNRGLDASWTLVVV